MFIEKMLEKSIRPRLGSNLCVCLISINIRCLWHRIIFKNNELTDLKQKHIITNNNLKNNKNENQTKKQLCFPWETKH